MFFRLMSSVGRHCSVYQDLRANPNCGYFGSCAPDFPPERVYKRRHTGSRRSVYAVMVLRRGNKLNATMTILMVVPIHEFSHSSSCCG
ncbi:MAG: hypothetical protein ACXV8Q_01480 [Methylobacter sp.]